MFNHPEPSRLLPHCFSCLCSLVKHSGVFRSCFRKCPGTHKTGIYHYGVPGREEMPSAQRLKKCTGDIAGRRRTTRGASVSLGIAERKRKQAPSNTVFNATLKSSFTLADIRRCFSCCRIACCCVTICC